MQEVIALALLASLDAPEPPRDEAGFNRALEQARGKWVPIAMELEKVLLNFLAPVAAALNKLNAYKATDYADSRADIQAQISALVGEGRLLETPVTWLEQYPRYAKALLHRCERLSGQYGKDQASMTMLRGFLERLENAVAAHPGLLQLAAPALQFRWMLEEFRVSLFAQQLGTKTPVSAKRMQEQWRLVERWMAENPR